MNVFTKYFLKQGHNVTIFDIDKSRSLSLTQKFGCNRSNTLENAVSANDLVLLCTPLDVTPRLIERVIPLMKPCSLLGEISSIKKHAVKKLKDFTDKIQSISIHPMFGPDIEDFTNQTMIVIPVSNEEKESSIVEGLFPDSKIVISNEIDHDKCMASILTLPYFMNIVFAKVISKEKIIMLREFAGSSFRAQLAISECIAAENTELIESLIKCNSFSKDIINQFIDETRYLRRLLKNHPTKFKKYCNSLKKDLLDDPEFINARKYRNQELLNFSNSK